MQKRKKIPALLLTLLLMLVLAPAAYADTDPNTPQITQQPDQLVLQLGARWAGVEFELRTDAGVFPVPVVVDESGILRMDLGGSTTYTLSCINSTVPIPDPEQTEPDTPPTTQKDPAPSQPSANNTSGSNTRNVAPVVFFLALSSRKKTGRTSCSNKHILSMGRMYTNER